MDPISPSANSAVIPLDVVENPHWPAIEPLPEISLLPVLEFQTNWLPSGLDLWILDYAERSGCPIDYLAVSAMVEIAVLVGRKCAIYPKKHDDWLVVPNLWGAVIGRPSAMKSPAIQAMLKPLKKFEDQKNDDFAREVREYEIQSFINKAAQESAKKKLVTASQKDDQKTIALVKEQLCEIQNTSANIPKRKRFITNDSTVEKLGVLLNENPNGLLLLRDELTGWLSSMEKHDRLHEKAFYLECFNGSGDYTFDRVTRESVHIESTIISVLGGITPGKLKPYIRGAVEQGI